MYNTSEHILDQGCQTQFLEVQSPAEFRCNPKLTHLIQLIKSFRLIRKLHGLCVGAGLEQNWGTEFDTPVLDGEQNQTCSCSHTQQHCKKTEYVLTIHVAMHTGNMT